MTAIVHCDVACSATVPAAPEIRRWVDAALRHAGHGGGELTVRMVEAAEMATLNQDYRGKPGTTNVLSFASDVPKAVASDYLGDIVIDALRVREEAHDQDKSETAHWAHLVVHGVLHLVGHRHDEAGAAEQMERLEREILAEFGYADPYA